MPEDSPLPVPAWLDLSEERMYWQVRCAGLPCGAVAGGFEACWMMISDVYALFLKYPRLSLECELALFLSDFPPTTAALPREELEALFAQVWGRILRKADGRALPDWRASGA